ncbi:MAG: Holliday junction resolvase RuvX [Nitratireductor sp.]|nr:Holliday junction resolvase RuvX [Nitratireductor sp.]MCB1458507.1 Holliday junction resolvase RuvX [Nitratireductor sp.]
MENPVDLETLKSLHQRGQRLFGIDPGTKTIGIAVCDGGLSIATPYHTIRRTKFTADLAELARLVKIENVYGLVIGLPLNMDGSEGPRAQSTRAFIRNMRGKLDLPVALQDERLSTVAAHDAMSEVGVRYKKRMQNIDAAAAAVILQTALERMAQL